MSNKGKHYPVFEEKMPLHHLEEHLDRLQTFRMVYAHFPRGAAPREETVEFPSTPALEARQAMQQAKTSYDSMVDMQQRLHQAYHEIVQE